MTTIQARNVNDAYNAGLELLKREGRVETSRLGPVKVTPFPVMTIYEKPCERVLFDSTRNANPFFHMAEAIWMLSGSNDIRWLANFNKQMLEYSDNGRTTHGAYGHRWRRHFSLDQLDAIIGMLRRDRQERKAVLAMWDVDSDLHTPNKDIPCNTHIYFRVIVNKLDMTVMCRSNDVIWGCYGANVVHFSFLQEFMASAIGVDVGKYYHFSNNYHIYKHHWPLMESMAPTGGHYPPTIPLTKNGFSSEVFLLDCEHIIAGQNDRVENEFLFTVAVPMINAWRERSLAHSHVAMMPECDWKLAAQQWLARADQRKISMQDGFNSEAFLLNIGEEI